MAGGFDRPKLVSDTSSGDQATIAIETLNRRIFRHPEVYAVALETLGTAATDGSVELHVAEDEHALDQLGTKSLSPESLILTYFKKRYDFDATFDPATEEALSSDPTHATLQATFRHNASMHRSKAVSGKLRRPNEEAAVGRDEIRRHRLAFFIARVTDWRATLEDSTKLPSAG
ncbi:MAG: hypothetical protein WAS36_04970 [Candidatus Saccharimonadales bacterium]